MQQLRNDKGKRAAEWRIARKSGQFDKLPFGTARNNAIPYPHARVKKSAADCARNKPPPAPDNGPDPLLDGAVVMCGEGGRSEADEDAELPGNEIGL